MIPSTSPLLLRMSIAVTLLFAWTATGSVSVLKQDNDAGSGTRVREDAGHITLNLTRLVADNANLLDVPFKTISTAGGGAIQGEALTSNEISARGGVFNGTVISASFIISTADIDPKISDIILYYDRDIPYMAIARATGTSLVYRGNPSGTVWDVAFNFLTDDVLGTIEEFAFAGPVVFDLSNHGSTIIVGRTGVSTWTTFMLASNNSFRSHTVTQATAVNVFSHTGAGTQQWGQGLYIATISGITCKVSRWNEERKEYTQTASFDLLAEAVEVHLLQCGANICAAVRYAEMTNFGSIMHILRATDVYAGTFITIYLSDSKHGWAQSITTVRVAQSANGPIPAVVYARISGIPSTVLVWDSKLLAFVSSYSPQLSDNFIMSFSAAGVGSIVSLSENMLHMSHWMAQTSSFVYYDSVDIPSCMGSRSFSFIQEAEAEVTFAVSCSTSGRVGIYWTGYLDSTTDFVGISSGVARFTAGSSNTAIAVGVINNRAIEFTETFGVELFPGTPEVIHILVNIEDDDATIFKESVLFFHTMESDVPKLDVTIGSFETIPDIGSNIGLKFLDARPSTLNVTTVKDSGLLTVKSYATSEPLDRELTPVLRLDIFGYDTRIRDSSEVKYDILTIYVIVNDRADNVPGFVVQLFTFEVRSDSRPGLILGRVVADILDSTSAQPIGSVGSTPQYSITAVNGNRISTPGTTRASIFRLSSTTGQIVTEELVDKSKFHDQGATVVGDKSVFCSSCVTLTVKVQNAGGSAEIGVHLIWVAVPGQNLPSFYEPDLLRLVLISAPKVNGMFSGLDVPTDLSIPLGPIIAGIPATPESGPILFSISAGNEDGLFSPVVFGNTGVQIHLIKPLPDPTRNQYIITIRVSDSLAEQFFSETKLVIDVSTGFANSGNYVIPGINNTYAIPESTPVGEIVAKLFTPDLSSVSFFYVRPTPYTIHTNRFSINANGDIVTSAELDYEDPLLRKFHLVATIAYVDGSTADVQFNITVTDDNDNIPEFAQLSKEVPSIPELSAVGLFVTSVRATDIDSGQNGEISYSLLSAIPSGLLKAFEIDPVSGVITVSNSKLLDLGKIESFLPALDFGGFAIPSDDICKYLTCKSHCEAHITGNCAWDSSGSGFCYVGEQVNTAVGGTVGACTPLFPTIVLSVMAQDNGIPYSFSVQDIAIKLFDSNNNRPIFSNTTQATEVSEDALRGTVVAVLTMSDGDIDPFNRLVTFDLIGEPVPFQIITGRIIVSGRLDREFKPSYDLVVSGSDGTFEADIQKIVVTITDVNDSPPEVVLDRTSVYVAEGTIPSFLARAIATDDDLGENRRVSFSLSSSTDSAFVIDSVTGSITATRMFDYELIAERIFTVGVIATDKGVPSLTSTTAILIVNVEDRNDNSPIFVGTIDGRYQKKVPSETYVGEIGQVTAADLDSGAFGSITYSIKPGASVNNLYSIDAKSGMITIVREADREVGQRDGIFLNTVEVVATDGGSLSSTVYVDVVLSDSDDNAPVFLSSSYTSVISEGALEGTVVAELNWIDMDSTAAKRGVEFDFVNGSYVEYFHIDNVTGRVTLTKMLDLPGPVIELTITIAQPPPIITHHKSTASVQILVDLINRNPPRFSKPMSFYTFALSENTPLETLVATLTATDDDPDSPTGEQRSYIHFEIVSDNSNGMFDLQEVGDGETVRVVLAKAVDREADAAISAGGQYIILVRATDSGKPNQLSELMPITIIINDVNEYSPEFSTLESTANVSENSDIGSIVTTVKASDKDATTMYNTVVYQILSGSPYGEFMMNPSSGEISVNSKLDRESVQQYTLLIMATDGEKASVHQIGIKVLDENDNYPIFDGKYKTVTLVEDLDAGLPIAIVSANDSDYGLNGTITFGIGAETHSAFRIDKTSGLVTSTFKFDYEAPEQREFDVNITASDGGTPSRSTWTMLSIIVADANDNTPTFTSDKIGPFVISEMYVGEIGLITAYDLDSGPYGHITYSILEGTDGGGLFVIDQFTGMVSAARGADREVGVAEYTIIVVATDSDILAPRSATTAVQIKVDDIDDNAPTYLQLVYSSTIFEESSIGTLVAQLKWSDSDSTVGAQSATFIIVSGDEEENFQVDNQGKVTVAKSLVLDRPTVRLEVLLSKPADSEPPLVASSQSVAFVSIGVDLRNTAPPEFTQGRVFNVSVSESQVIGAELLFLLATDDDPDGPLGQLRSAVSYSITSDSSEGLFELETTGTGAVLVLSSSLDRERYGKHTILIDATDDGRPKMTSTALVEIHVTDVNEFAPTFSSPTSSTDIIENCPIGTTVASLSAFDDDATAPFNTITYSIVNGDSNNNFNIDLVTGELTVVKVLDRENISAYVLTVVASDGSRFGSHTIQIAVLDENDNSPQIFDTQKIGLITEFHRVGLPIMDISTTDRDEGINAIVTYSFGIGSTKDPDGSVPFQIDPVSGLITSTRLFDYEKIYDRSLSLNVTATDGGTPTRHDWSIFTVQVTDENDNKPIFRIPKTDCLDDPIMKCHTAAEYTFALEEGYTGLIGSVLATDPDQGASGQVRYSIVDSRAAGGLLTVDASTGLMYVTRPFDRENGEKDLPYVLKYSMIASDSDVVEPKSRSIDVIVTISDLDDNKPVFVQEIYAVVMKSESVIGSYVTTMEWIDGDATAYNRGAEFEIISGDPTNIFMISSETGEITTRKALQDMEDFLLEVHVSPPNNSQRIHDSAAFVRIVIDHENIKGPVFDQSSYTFTVPESIAISEIVGEIRAIDDDKPAPDGVERDAVTFSITSDNSGGRFVIQGIEDVNTILIALAKDLDTELNAGYVLEITATDSGRPKINTTVLIRINIDDINEFAPKFDFLNLHVDVLENSALGTAVHVARATDNDATIKFNTIYYTVFAGDPHRTFTINSVTGVLTVARPIDRESQPSYLLTIMAKDIDFAATQILNITVLDENDNDPNLSFFNELEYRELAENSPAETFIVKIDATDADVGKNSDVAFAFANPSPEGFAIDSISGIVTTTRKFDYEDVDNRSMILYVTGTDNGSPSRTSIIPVTVMLRDLNDNNPKFMFEEYVVTLYENFVGIALRVTATDDDSDIFGDITYDIDPATVDARQSLFVIDAFSGEISTSGGLDIEADQTPIHLIIRATDGGSVPNPTFASSVSVYIRIVGIDDHAPVFSPKNYEVTILQEIPIGFSVVNLTWTDADVTPEHNRGLFEIITGNANEIFSINEVGNILIAQSLGNRTDDFILEVSVSVLGPPPQVDIGTVHIYIDSLNPAAPKFNESVIFKSVSETTPEGTVVCEVHATDADTGIRGYLTFSITGGDSANLFIIKTSNTGFHLITLTTFDAETTRSHTVTVTATDGGRPQKSSNVTIVIEIMDANDVQPAFRSTSLNDFVNEDAVNSHIIATLEAIDGDVDEINRQLTYSIRESTPFGVDGNNLIVNMPLDREATALYRFTIEVTDGEFTATQVAVITVNDVNDNVPELITSKLFQNLPENIEIGTLVAVISATDADVGANGTVRFALQNNAIGFNIDERTGSLTTAASFDFEDMLQRWFNIVVVASDQGTPVMMTQLNLTYSLSNVNDNSPIFNQSSYTFSFPENKGGVLGHITAKDADDGLYGQLRYWMNADQSPFLMSHVFIDEASGILSMKSQPVGIDREALESGILEFTVYAVDMDTVSPRESSVKVRLEIEDLDDNAPKFSQRAYEAKVLQEALVGTVVLTLNWTDIDATAGHRQNIAEIIGGDTYEHFSIDIYGQIRLIKSLFNYSTFLLQIRVGNQQNTLQDFVSVTVNVDSINKMPPTFESHSGYQVKILENAAAGTPVSTLKALDVDQGSRGVVTYSLVNATGGFWALDAPIVSDGSATLRLQLAKLDFEAVGFHTATIMATDNGRPRLSRTTVVSITVVDVNDNAPSFLLPTQTILLPENSSVGTVVAFCPASDLDASTKYRQIIYSIVSGDTNGIFSIDSDGTIVLAAPVDYESQIDYSLSIMASDGKYKTTAKIAVSVTDINDVRPAFIEDTPFLIKIDENLPLATEIVRIIAIDQDQGNSGEIKYLLENPPPFVKIDEYSGRIITVGEIDFETLSSPLLMVTVVATDMAPPFNAARHLLRLQIADLNDNFPTFERQKYAFTIPEGTSKSIGMVRATDEDSGVRGEIRYSINASHDGAFVTGLFGIDPTSGSVMLLRTLNREDMIDVTEYRFTVWATDGSPIEPKSSVAEILVSIDDVNDNVPTFAQSLYTTEIMEEISPGVSILSLDWFDGDMTPEYKESVFDIIAGDTLGNFAITSDGTLVVTKSLTSPDAFRLTIRIRNIAPLTPLFAVLPPRTCTVVVDVNPFNKGPPTFSQNQFTIEISESSVIDSAVIKVSATDDGLLGRDSITYSISNGNSKGLFTVNPTSGAISVAGRLDRETQERHVLMVTATDSGRPPKASTVPLVVILSDVNDNPPIFMELPKVLYVAASAADGSSVTYGDTLATYVQATDSDAGANGAVTYSLYSATGGTESHFSMNPTSGEITTLGRLDHPSGPFSYVVRISATDGGNPPLSAHTVLTVHIVYGKNSIADFVPNLEGNVDPNGIGSTAGGVAKEDTTNLATVSWWWIVLGLAIAFSAFFVIGLGYHTKRQKTRVAHEANIEVSQHSASIKEYQRQMEPFEPSYATIADSYGDRKSSFSKCISPSRRSITSGGLPLVRSNLNTRTKMPSCQADPGSPVYSEPEMYEDPALGMLTNTPRVINEHGVDVPVFKAPLLSPPSPPLTVEKRSPEPKYNEITGLPTAQKIGHEPRYDEVEDGVFSDSRSDDSDKNDRNYHDNDSNEGGDNITNA